MESKQKYSKEAYDSLVRQLEELKNVRRPQIVHQIEEARSFGDLSENAEYDSARTEQAKGEAEIKELEDKIRNAEIINESEIDTAAVSIGSVVTVEDEDGEQEEYVIVSQNEVDSFSNRISNQCPIGKALAGHRVGDLVTVMVENQKGVMISSYKLKILSVERKEKSEPHV